MLRQTVGAAGGTQRTTFGSRAVLVQQSVGQASVIGTYRAGDVYVHQGFLQPPGTAVQEVRSEELTVTVFPNPFHGDLRLRFERTPSGPFQVELHDLVGRVIWHAAPSSAPEVLLNIPGLTAGQYLLVLRAGDARASFHLQYLPMP